MVNYNILLVLYLITRYINKINKIETKKPQLRGFNVFNRTVALI